LKNGDGLATTGQGATNVAVTRILADCADIRRIGQDKQNWQSGEVRFARLGHGEEGLDVCGKVSLCKFQTNP
jgi:hypothetical protein